MELRINTTVMPSPMGFQVELFDIIAAQYLDGNYVEHIEYGARNKRRFTFRWDILEQSELNAILNAIDRDYFDLYCQDIDGTYKTFTMKKESISLPPMRKFGDVFKYLRVDLVVAEL